MQQKLRTRNGTVWVKNHQQDKRNQKYNRKNNGDAIEVFLHNARAGLRRINRASNHIRNASSLAGVQQDENNQTNARNNEQYKQYYEKRIHDVSLLSFCLG